MQFLLLLITVAVATLVAMVASIVISVTSHRRFAVVLTIAITMTKITTTISCRQIMLVVDLATRGQLELQYKFLEIIAG